MSTAKSLPVYVFDKLHEQVKHECCGRFCARCVVCQAALAQEVAIRQAITTKRTKNFVTAYLL